MKECKAEHCVTHHRKEDMYCYNCHLTCCEECARLHAGNSHATKKVIEIASEKVQKLVQLRQVSESALKENVGYLAEVEKRLVTLTEEGLKVLDESFEGARRKLREFFSGQFESLTMMASECHKKLEAELQEVLLKEELARWQALIDCENYTELVHNAQPRLDEQPSVVSRNAYQLREEIQRLSDSLAKHYKELQATADSLQKWRVLGDKQLDSIFINLLRVYKERDKGLREQQSKFANAIVANLEAYNESTTLKHEKLALEERIRQVQEQLDEMEEVCMEYEDKARVLEQTSKDRLAEIARLDEAIKGKQALLQKFDERISAVSLRPLNGTKDGKDHRPDDALEEEKKTAALLKELAELKSAAHSQQEILMMQSKFIYFYDAKSLTFQIYDLASQRLYLLRPSKCSIPPCHDATQLRDRIYLSGGYDSVANLYYNAMQAFEVVNNENIAVSSKKPMTISKAHHKLLALDTRTILSLGGVGKGGQCMDICEKYDVQSDMWGEMASLSQKKARISATAFNCEVVYVFGGFNDKQKFNVIETIRPHSETKWKVVHLQKSEHWRPVDQLGCFQCDAAQILLFGGLDKANVPIDEAFVFDPAARTLIKANVRPLKPDLYPARSPTRYNNRVYIFGTNSQDIHSYGLDDHIWNLIEQSQWQRSITSESI